MGAKGWKVRIGLGVAVAAAACVQDKSPVEVEQSNQSASSPAAEATTVEHWPSIVTSNPAALARSVRAVAVRGSGDEYEVLVWIKNASTPSRDVATFAEFVQSRTDAIGVGPLQPGQQPRGGVLPDRASDAAVAAVLDALKGFGIEPYRRRYVLPVIMVRVPDTLLEGVLSALMGHSNVDFVAANVGRPMHPAVVAGPVGTNPIDVKHSVHFVTGAWDRTRGSAAKTARIGILDSGFAGNVNGDGTYHPDGQEVGDGGITKIGFIDDIGPGGCQSAASCPAWEDNWEESPTQDPYAGGHGTTMAGIAGANDNDLGGQEGAVGIAPAAHTYSMKIAYNTFRDGAGACSGIWPFLHDDQYCVHDDDFTAAVDWASANGLDVLSMSFNGDQGSSVHTALSAAYYTHQIVLLASLGNEAGESDDLVRRDYIAGVGAVNQDGTFALQVNLQWLDFSGSFIGRTTLAFCPVSFDWCSVGTPATWGPVAGTSPATAAVAGVIGLLRSNEPTLSAPDVISRLWATSWSPRGVASRVVDAGWALENHPNSVGITGVDYIDSPGVYTWSAVAGYPDSYTYTWFISTDGGSSWFPVGDGSTYSRNVVEEGYYTFDLEVVAAAQGRTAWSAHGVLVNLCPPGQETC